MNIYVQRCPALAGLYCLYLYRYYHLIRQSDKLSLTSCFHLYKEPFIYQTFPILTIKHCLIVVLLYAEKSCYCLFHFLHNRL